MKYQKPFSAAILALLFSATAHASDWWIVDISKDVIFFIDVSSIKKDESGAIKGWTQSVKRDGKSARTLWFYKCDNEESGAKSMNFYKADGSPDGNIVNDVVEFEPTPPDTLRYDLLQISCAEDPASKLDKPYQRQVQESEAPSDMAKSIFQRLDESKAPAIPKKRK